MMNHQITTVEQARTYITSVVDALPKQYKDLAYAAMKLLGYWTVPSASGTNGNHHTMDGGHAIHTAQVLQIALDMLRSIPHSKVPETIVAVVWHDAMKVEDYESLVLQEGDSLVRTYPQHEEGKRKTTRAYKLMRHLVNSAMEFRAVSRENPTYTVDLMLIEHIILSHHGRKEWGSPVEPQTVEAWAVHAADMMSSQFCVLPVENNGAFPA